MKSVLDGLRRDARLAEFRLLFAALAFIAVAMSAVSLFGSRVELAMQAQTGALFGADGVIASTRPVDARYASLASELGLETARTVSFLSMVATPAGTRLARVKAVSDNYPLRGEVVTQPAGSNSEGVGTARLGSGDAWIAGSLARDLGIEAGETLGVGRRNLSVEREILLEPEGGMGSFRIAPRVMIALSDLDSTGLVTPASRARFQLLVSGSADSLAAFGREVDGSLASYESWHVADLSNDEVESTVGRVVSYLRLAVLLSVVLAIVAMALAAQGLWRRQVYAGALMRCLGASHGESVRRQTLIYLLAAVPVGAIGVLAGCFLQFVAASVVVGATGIVLPSPNLTPALVVWAISAVTAVMVMVPFLLAQRRIPVMVLLRAQHRDRVNAGAIGVAVVIALVILFALVLAGDYRLAASVLAGILAAGIVFWLLIRLVLAGIAGAMPKRASALNIGLENLVSNARRSAWLASAFGATVFALVLLGAVRADLFDAWDRSIPVDAPNVFLVNVQPDEVAGARELLEEENLAHERFYPIFRGRLVEIGGEAVDEEDYDSDRARQRINHEFNLTEDGELPEGNEIVAGDWFSANEAAFSVEEETARSLGIEIGEHIAFDIGGSRIEAPVTSIRSVRWDSMKPNFFVLGSPGLFGDAPRSFITAVRVDTDTAAFSRLVSERFPAVTVVDLDMILARLRSLVAQASTAVSVVFVFTLGAALMVLVGVLQGQRAARRREIALLKTLGATRARVRAVILVEFGLLGAVAGLVGGAIALASGWLLAVNVFEFAYVPDWRWLAASVAGGAVVVGISGYMSIRPLIRVQPVRLLAG